MPMTYMAGFLNTLLSPWMAGATAILAPPFDATTALRFWEPARAHDVNTLWLTPTIISALCRLDRDPTVREWTRRTLRSVFAGTAPLPEAKSADFERRFGAKPLESYGMTELLLVTGNRSGRLGRPGSVGRPLPDIETAFRRKSGSHGQAGNTEQLWVRTPYALKGYVEPDTKELVSPLTDGWLSTGDLGHRDDDGNLFITGREKDLIIRGGANVSPVAIEGALLHHADVVEAAVIGVPHDFWGEEVVACLELSRSKSLDAVRASLIESCREQAPMVPDRFVSMDTLPRGVSGKIQKHSLRERLISGVC
jgi:long-chain acyl-CoA synthetase